MFKILQTQLLISEKYLNRYYTNSNTFQILKFEKIRCKKTLTRESPIKFF